MPRTLCKWKATVQQAPSLAQPNYQLMTDVVLPAQRKSHNPNHFQMRPLHLQNN